MRIHSQDSFFDLRETEMVEVFANGYEMVCHSYSAAREEVAKGFVEAIGHPIVTYMYIPAPPMIPFRGHAVFRVFADGKVYFGCQHFDAENAKKLRAWALPEEESNVGTK